MRKTIIFLFLIIVLSVASKNTKDIIIPQKSIRFRIVANSNSLEDQALKWKVNENILPILNSIDSSSYENSRESLRKSVNQIEKEIDKMNIKYKISLGNNYFPEKKYENIIYPEDNYESLVITLGEGKGDNWWCVLFPPLCLMESQKENVDKITYKSYIKQIINKYF